MKLLRKSPENEMLIEFLRAEYSSERFNEQIKAKLNELGYDERIILSADICSSAENNQRKSLMGEFRGYALNRDLFERFPPVIDWSVCSFGYDDLEKIRYIDYSYWNELSDGTHSPLTAAKAILGGKTVYDESNDGFLRAAEFIRGGGKFPKMFFLTGDYESFVIVEGHLRMTAYALAPDYFNDIEVIVGECRAQELRKWM